MPNISAVYSFILDTNTAVKVGDGKTTVSIPVTAGKVVHLEDMVAAENYGTVILWTTGQGLTTFEWGLLVSDKDVFVELRNDDTGTPEFMLIEVKAKVPAYIPAKFGSSTAARIDGALFVDNTDYADTDRIQVQRNAATGQGDAKVDLFLFA